MKNKSNGITERQSQERSEEIQAIIDRMPTGWTRWVALCVAMLIGIIIFLGAIIRYPDTVDGQIAVTSTLAPVKLVAMSSGRIAILKENMDSIHIGDILGYLETGASLEDVRLLDSLLSCESDLIPDGLVLGDLGQLYSSYSLALSQYTRIKTSDLYPTMRSGLHDVIKSQEAVLENMKTELGLREQNIKDMRERLFKDSALASIGGLSLREYEERLNSYRIAEESMISFRSGILSKISEINSNRVEVRKLSLQESETEEEAMTTLITSKNNLLASIEQWKERYLFISPIDGMLEHVGFIRDNDFIQSGSEVFSILPRREDTVGEVIIPAIGAGKVVPGQQVNVKMSSFPYDEYGYLTGMVQKVSRLSRNIQTSNGSTGVYSISVVFPEGLVTNFGIPLPLDFGSIGTAEIVTKRRRLLERLFDNLKSKGVK